MCIGSYADISIYVPTIGATYIYAHHLNSTLISIHAPTRGATFYSRGSCSTTCISIHAPTRGATYSFLSVYVIFTYFNPRSHERSDASFDTNFHKQAISIHAPTRGATAWQNLMRCINGISIHAPTRGATISKSDTNIAYIFQSTLPREERQSGHNSYCNCIKFQSTLPREERLLQSIFCRFS